jgi:hypothetical protein
MISTQIHVHYEQQPEYPLTKTEKKGEKLDYYITKMKLNKDKTSLIYNQFLTLSGIPKQTYDYRLGNRSALEWVIDQYQVSTDKRSGITNDPNRENDKSIYRNFHPRQARKNRPKKASLPLRVNSDWDFLTKKAARDRAAILCWLTHRVYFAAITAG